VPVVNIGTRQDGRIRGSNVTNVNHNKEAIKAAIKKQIEHGPYPQEKLYGDGKAGEKIADAMVNSNLRIEKKIAY
jgi:UDP-N-acetylglucosamine 2-epimerase